MSEDKENNIPDLDLSPHPFSPGAFIFLKDHISQYIKDLVNESIRVSKRHRADTVSTAHIERASENLIYNIRRRIFKHVGMLGGILFGSALSVFLTMWIDSQYREKGIIFAIISGVLGSVMITVHVSKD